jgi:hypothetical protein
MAEIQKVSYTHDAMIDCIIANPSVTGGQLAAVFGYTPAWVSQVVSSDGFKSRLAERKGELVDPGISASIEQRMEGILRQSMDIIAAQLQVPGKEELAMKTLEATSKALGFGARDRAQATQNNFVVMMPQPAASVADWQAAQQAPQVVEMEPVTQGE